MSTAFKLPTRQVHLDFHTSPFILDVGVAFDGKEFAKTFKEAHVNSVTVFAKCHHGQCYYPTQTGTQHPALKGQDLLGEQIEALHRVGIRCPIYTTVVWEEDAAQKHPEWRKMRRNGTFVPKVGSTNMKELHAGGWEYNNFLHPDYQDYIEAHVSEICGRYDVDGFFFDILFFETSGCWSEESIKFREKHGLLANDLATFQRFEATAQASFSKKFTKIVRSIKPKATIFYNAGNDMNVDISFCRFCTIFPYARAWKLT